MVKSPTAAGKKTSRENMKKVASLLLFMMLLSIPGVLAHPYSSNNSGSITIANATMSTVHFPLDATDPAISGALAYLSGVQDADGDIGGFSTSCWASIAIASTGNNPDDWKKGGNSVVDYLVKEQSQVDTSKIVDISKFILALNAANRNPRNVTGVDYISMLEGKENGGQFGDESLYNDDFWAIIALVSASVSPNSPEIQSSASFIKNHQNSDGGWSWHSGDSDPDDTAAAIMALTASGESSNSPSITNAVNYLKTQLHPNGGFSYMGQANAASDSWAIMSLTAARVDPTGSEWIRNDTSPVDHLLELQNQDGSFSYVRGQPGSAWWTAYAIPALLGQPYPITKQNTSTTTTSASSVTTAATTTSLSSTSTTNSIVGQVHVRVEDINGAIWIGNVEIPQSATVQCYNSGKTYSIQGDNVLAVLDQAAKVGGFTYQISDQWYPDLGFYLYSVGGHTPQGEYGWMYRVNYNLGNVSINNFKISASDNILIYWGTNDVRPLTIEVDHNLVDVGQNITATVEYLDNGTWLPLAGASVHVNDTYLTDANGKATITLRENRVYNIYAEKWGDAPDNQFVTSDIVQVEAIGQTTTTVTTAATTTSSSSPMSTTTVASCCVSTTGATTVGVVSTQPILPPSPPQHCVIATAAYGSEMAPDVVYMRYVRDKLIGSTPTGRILVAAFNAFYYSWSPMVAQSIAGDGLLRAIFRVLLLPLVGIIHIAAMVFATVTSIAGRTDVAGVVAFLAAATMTVTVYVVLPVVAAVKLRQAVRSVRS